MAAPQDPSHVSEVQPVPAEERSATGNIFETTWIIGGTGGFELNVNISSTGHRLRRIQVWAESDKIRGIRLWTTDGVAENNYLYGTAVSTTRSYDFRTDEYITSMSLWGNGIGTRLGWIRFRTNTGGFFDFGMTRWSLQTEYPLTVGSGICLGWIGRSNLDIDSFGFRFLRPIRSSTIRNVSYPNIDAQTFPIRPETLQEFRSTNNSSQPNDWTFSNQKEVTQSSSWSITAGLVFGATIGISAGIPLIADVSGEFRWEVSVSGTFTQEYSRTDTLAWDKSGTLPPGTSVHLLAITRTGSVDLPYSGTMQLIMTNDSQLTYPVRGQYNGVSYHGVEVVTSDFRSIQRVEDHYVSL